MTAGEKVFDTYTSRKIVNTYAIESISLSQSETTKQTNRKCIHTPQQQMTH